MENQELLHDDSIVVAIETLYTEIVKHNEEIGNLIKAIMGLDVNNRNALLGEVESVGEVMKVKLEKLHDVMHQVELLKKFVEEYNV